MPLRFDLPWRLEVTVKPFEGRYGEYLLKYKPQPTPDGRFLAYVIVLRVIGCPATVGAVTPDLASFALQGEAAAAGWVAGIRWIDRDKFAPPLAARSPPTRSVPNSLLAGLESHASLRRTPFTASQAMDNP